MHIIETECPLLRNPYVSGKGYGPGDSPKEQGPVCASGSGLGTQRGLCIPVGHPLSFLPFPKDMVVPAISL